QSCHGATPWYQARADFPLRQDGSFATRKAHVAGECKLTSDTGRPSPNQRYRHDRRTTQAHQHVGQWMQPCGSGRQTHGIFRSCKEIVVSQKEPLDSAVKNHHLDLLVSFECSDDLVQLRDRFGTEDVERRVIKRDSPIRGRAPGQTYLCGSAILVV